MYLFSYKNTDASYTTAEVEMRVPEHCNVTEILDFFQRFLVASGFMFNDDEVIKVVNENEPEETPLTFNKGDVNVTDDGTWRVHDGDSWLNFNSTADPWGLNTTYIGSGVFGGIGDDHITLAGGPVPIPGAAGKDIITFS